MEELLVGIIYFAVCLLVGWFARWMMNRSVIGWTVLALLFTPIAAFIFVCVAGEARDADEELRKYTEAKKRHDTAAAEKGAEGKCPSCGTPINLATRRGISASEEEPWRISCARCSRELDGAAL